MDNLFRISVKLLLDYTKVVVGQRSTPKVTYPFPCIFLAAYPLTSRLAILWNTLNAQRYS